MKTFLMKSRIPGLTTTALALILLLASACNHDFEVKIQKHKPGDTATVNIPQRKVLYLIVDGLRGRSIPQINPPTILRMTSNALYTFDGLGANNEKEISSWANMLTGVTPDKHKVTGDDLAGNDLATYPTIFTRLKAADESVRTAAFYSSPELADSLLSGADVNENLNNDDEAVKNALIDELQNDDKVTVALGEFNSVKAAGDQESYDTSSAEYVNAVMAIDGYISDILDALKKRKNYKNEDWLVIVASDQGGAAAIPPGQNTNNVFGNPVLNSFIIFYNPRFTSKIVSKPNTANIPYDGYTIRLKDKGVNENDFGDAVNAYVPAPAEDYNFGKTGEFTVQIKVKIFDFGSTWPSFFGKRRTSENTSDPGWEFMFHEPASGHDWRIKLGSNKTTSAQVITDSVWHILTMKVYNDGDKRMVVQYTDGAKSSATDITGSDLSNDLPLVAGWNRGWTSTQPTLFITDIKIWNTALSDSYIDEHGGDVGLNENSPYYGNIIGYWPCTDGIGDKFKDESGNHNDMIFNITDKNKADFGWEHFSDLSGRIFPPLPSDLRSTVPGGVDIPYMIYHWMGIDASSWNLDGQFWLPGYNDVK